MTRETPLPQELGQRAFTVAEALPRNNSPMETRARLRILRGGLPEPELNVVIPEWPFGDVLDP